MSEVKWIKLSTSMFEDEKIRLIESMPEADTLLIIWIRLLAQAGKTNASGYIFLSKNIPYSDEMLATLFNRPITTVRLALQTFQQFGMIEITNDQYICISNWEKHQNVDGLEKIREQNRLRKQKQREKLKLEMSRDSHETITQSHATDIEEDKELDKDKELEIINTSSSDESDTKVSIPYQEILSYLNEKADKNFNHKAESHKKLIKARWNEGYTVENFKTVIDNKVSQWFGKFDREGKPLDQYLRPSTLFAQKHFDNYLNETVKGAKNNDPIASNGAVYYNETEFDF
ncbi:phage replisome organizer N-terminal domain-containing protein [Bacillus sp. FSL M7-1020]|uniref:phage replisome organizer N-terminal domain-containing protein n=1 Tax=Bacillus TaxID=1386 RepID=UPI0007781B2D|nr:phage replisome organizer N-terminal domain-containing protein [Bacillus toyonensis]KXY48870.1 replication protein [Bacillus cereus]MBG9610572.1 replication protein [Bacillus toyonensis]MBG9843342.1 replication protein [Bacillus toyonensis]MBG9852740.1 replication protein [Bacillus toyonensis]MBG9873568.1 replication protein [Bacillus toyonensis]